MAGYFFVTWATQHLPASQVPCTLHCTLIGAAIWVRTKATNVLCLQVAAFQCLQPFVGTLLAFLVLQEQPSLWHLGAVGVIAGLLIISRDKKDVAVSSSILRKGSAPPLGLNSKP